MALFLDGPISSVEDLHGYDTQLLDVATTEGIDVTQKLVQAHEEIATDVGILLEGTYPTAGIANVVVTPPLRMWHAFRSLEMVYRDAFNSQLNDRYAGKRDEYHELVKWARERVLQSGLGMAADPLPVAPTPSVAAIPGALPGGTYYVAVAWVNAGGEEGQVSGPATFAVSNNSFAVQHGDAPSNVRGWNVYIGSSPSTMSRQNSAVLPLNETWSQPDVLAEGGLAGAGQAPGYVQLLPRMILRG